MKAIKWISAIVVLTATLSLKAQTFTTLHSFTNADGQFPIAGLVLESNVLYGTTSQGGEESNGTVFAVNADGSNFRVLHNFSATDPDTGTNYDGSFPSAGLVLSGNTLYGVAAEGGTNTDGSFGYGTVFSVGTDGTNFTVLHCFNGSDGFLPHARLLLCSDTIYGTTYWGGAGEGAVGTIFSVKTNGADFNVIHAFDGYPEGANPEGGVILISNVFYGTTSQGGEESNGTLFLLRTNDAFTSVLHNFSGSEGSPHSGLVFSGDKIYGAATDDSSQGHGIIFSANLDGSDYAALHNFSVADSATGTNADGALPHCDLLVCGNALYGTTYYGGSQSNGVVFALNTDNDGYTVLHNFSGTDSNYANADGANSESSLVMMNNTLYGTATFGGSQGNGTIFSIQLPSAVGMNCNADGSVTIHFIGGAPINLLQAATNLSPPVIWQTISTNTAGVDGSWQFTDTNASSYPFRFYRSATP